MRNFLRLILTMLLSVIGGMALWAQNSVKVSGVVTSADDGLPMIGVAVMAGSGNGVITSLDGEYEIEVAPGTELIFSSIGFLDERFDNYYDFCYSDEFATAFQITGGRSLYSNCFAYWYSKRGEKHTAFRTTGTFSADVINLNVGFGEHNATKENRILEVAQFGGHGVFMNLHVGNENLVTTNAHLPYMH